jgi:hypothetical protein
MSSRDWGTEQPPPDVFTWERGACGICGVADVDVRKIVTEQGTTCRVCNALVAVGMAEDEATRPLTVVDLSIAVRFILKQLGRPQ